MTEAYAYFTRLGLVGSGGSRRGRTVYSYKMAQPGDKVTSYRTFLEARVLWPADIPDDILEFIVMTAKDAMRQNDPDVQGQEIAKTIKTALDEKYSPYWHVILGKSFGCHCTHETRRFVYFYLGKFAFMVYKIGY